MNPNADFNQPTSLFAGLTGEEVDKVEDVLKKVDEVIVACDVLNPSARLVVAEHLASMSEILQTREGSLVFSEETKEVKE